MSVEKLLLFSMCRPNVGWMRLGDVIGLYTTELWFDTPYHACGYHS